VVFPATGSYTVQLIATGSGGVDTTAQTIQVQVDQPNTANFAVNAGILYLPSAMLTCTNSSANANGYWWDFGDGATSQDTNPWHVYTQPGIYTVFLTAVNDACPADTASIQVQVLDVTGLDENPEFELQIYPNPAQNEVFVQVAFVTGNLHLYDQTGRLVYDGKLENGSQLIDVSKLSHGVYRLVAVNGDVVLDRNLVLVK
jgi:PKD domain/Secretion system C-terminal sorting domain